MKRRIVGFETDEHGDWRAALECGHFQHARHEPPLTTRSWVLTEAGRASRIGFELDCKRCDEADSGKRTTQKTTAFKETHEIA